jgi:hypothetical protein
MALIPPVSAEVTPVNNNTKSAIILFGSQDGRTWIPVTGILDYRSFIDKIIVHRFKGVYKYFTMVYAGRIERTTLNHIDIRLQERYMNRER